jgi:GH25 family lysozyme M1 (1,4-beta-N-acetylmuramidase)
MADDRDPYFGADEANTTKSSQFACQGVDVSKYQGEYDWDAAVAAGAKFGIARCSIGYGDKDPQFERNWAEMARLGVLRGAYHFAYPKTIAAGMSPADDARQEANYFCDQLLAAEAKVNSGRPLYDGKVLPPALDYEQRPELSAADQRSWVNAWIHTVQERTGRGVIIYSGDNAWRVNFGGDPWLTGLPFWVAHYSNGTKPGMKPWTRWVIWQWSGGESGGGDIYKKLNGSNFPGVASGGAVDLNSFWGSEGDLRGLGDPRRDRWLLDDDGSVGTNPKARPELDEDKAVAGVDRRRVDDALSKLYEARRLVDAAIAELEGAGEDGGRPT